MTALKQLVRRYLAAEIGYAEFRRTMVERFLSVRDADPVQTIVDLIGDETFEFSEGLIDEPELRRRLGVLCEEDTVVTANLLMVGVGKTFYTSTSSALPMLPLGAAAAFPAWMPVSREEEFA